MNKINLEAMATDELWSLHEQITSILSTRITSEKQELERRLAALGHSESTVARAGSERRAKRKYPKVFPKYRNPSTSETWSGRGKQPRWLVAALKSGRKITEFEIGERTKLKA
jgi:DNA-binding protein H-NS